MPTIPFLGLSITVHLSIILISRIFGFQVNQSRKPIFKKPATIKKISLAIIGSVFIIIMTNALMLTNTAFVEKHSSINLLENMVSEINKNSGAIKFSNTPDLNYSTPNYIVYEKY